MGRYNFVSEGAMAGNAIQEFLMQRDLMNQEQQRQAFLRQREEQGEKRAVEASKRAEAALALQQQQEIRIAEQQRLENERRAEQDAIDRSARQNGIGVRQMMTDRLSQGPLDRQTAEQLSVMGWSEGVGVPGVIERAAEAPRRTVMSTYGPNRERVRRAVSEDELIDGVLEYQESGDGGFTLGPGDVRYGTDGRVIARGAPRAEGGADDPQMPRGVQDYLASMKGRGYSREQAETEIFAADTWNRIREAHPRVSAVDVQQALGRFFPLNDLLGGGAQVSDGGGGTTPPETTTRSTGPGRTATSAQVRTAAQSLGMSESAYREELRKRGVEVED